MSEGGGIRDRVWLRRLLSVGGVTTLAVVMLTLAPLWVPLLAVVDLFRGRPHVALRCGLLVTWLALCEVGGLIATTATFVYSMVRPEGRADRFYALQRGWSSSIFAGARRIFRFELEVEGQEAAADTPVLLFFRHASIADTLLPSILVANHFGTRLRYVMKRELLWDPCLDIVGHQVPNYFVDRFSDDGKREAGAIGAMARQMGEGDGAIIYPEGTRFTPERRRRVMERLEASGDYRGLDRAQSFRHVLPPRMGGPLALLAAAPSADIVFCAHVGFEAVAKLPAVWRGDILDGKIRARLWRVPRSEVPTDTEGQREWLFDQWRQIDAWLDQQFVAAEVVTVADD